MYDLGPASFDSPARIAADGTGFVVSWIGDPDQITEALKVQHFQVNTTAGLVVVPDPVVSLMVGQQVFSPVIAGDGSGSSLLTNDAVKHTCASAETMAQPLVRK